MDLPSPNCRGVTPGKRQVRLFRGNPLAFRREFGQPPNNVCQQGQLVDNTYNAILEISIVYFALKYETH